MCLTFFSCLGKYQSGVDKPDPKTWKANFRCAMNSLPDIEEVKDKSIKKGNNAFRVYRMLPLSERPSKKGEGRACQHEMLLRALCWEKHLLQVAQYATSHQCKLHMVPWLAGKWVELRNSCVKNGLHSEGSISDVWYPQAVGICLLKLMELCSEPSPRSHSVKEYD